MRKELIWVIIIGVVIGLIIAFGVYRINFSLNSNKDLPTPSATPSTSAEFKVTLDKPQDGDVITESSVTVSGITKALSWVTVSGEDGDYTLQSDEGGIFSQDVALASGVNQIRVTVFDQNGNQSIEKVLVVYSSAFQVQTPVVPANATSESDIQQRIAAKVAQAMSNPKAYLGTVTDIADSTIQIKTNDSQIEQVSIGDAGITVVNVKGTNNKTVKLTDIAIGDYIVAMGYINGNSVLKAQRILISDPITEPSLQVQYGKVSAITKKNVSIANLKDGSSATFTPDKNTDIEQYSKGKFAAGKLSTITADDLTICVTTSDAKGNTLLRSLFDLTSS